MFEDTIRPQLNMGEDTIPMICAGSDLQKKVPRLKSGNWIAGYELDSLMSVTASSELWFAKDACVVKVSSQRPDMELLQQIQDADYENLAQILDFGRDGDLYYEVYPFYRNGCIAGVVKEEDIKTKILPGLLNALEKLHGMGILHNDIKPGNIFWDNDKNGILLGDFGTVGKIGARAEGYTPAYAAPEILLNNAGNRGSDWFSVGMTIAGLIDGKPLVEAKTPEAAMRILENGIRFNKGTAQFRQLVNGMLQVNLSKRLGPKAARKWCGDALFGGEEHETNISRSKVRAITIRFENPTWIAADLESLLKGIETHWEYSAFIFGQGKMDRFLRQFGNHIIAKGKEFQLLPNKEDALFRMTLELTEGRRFIWRGVMYHSLLELEKTWDSGEAGENDILTFLQLGLVSVCLKRKRASMAQLEFVKRLQDISHIHPAEACGQLFQALRGNDDFVWGTETISDLDNFVDWLSNKAATLDEEIDDLFKSKRFEAWLAYQGMDNVLEEIRRRCEL